MIAHPFPEMSSPSELPASAAVPIQLARTPSPARLLAAMAAGVSAAALAWVPGTGSAIPFLHRAGTQVSPLLTFAIAAGAGIGAAWVGWAVDSWKRRLLLLGSLVILSGTQSALMAQKFGIVWEPVSFAVAVVTGLTLAGLVAPRGAGVESYFPGRLAPLQLRRLAAAQSADFLLPDQREAAVLTCRMLNEAAIREQMPAREFLKLMESFRQTVSRVLLQRGALLDAPESGSVRAFFGLPLPVENHADDAAAAALELVDA